MADKFIFTMLRLNKFYGQKQVLKEINLSFFPGAKIGIVGENGAGKSTVLRIMAGLDDEFQGHAVITPGYKAGMVKQDPELDETLTVRQTIEQAFSDTKKLLDEYNDITARMAEPMSDDEMQAAMDRMGELQDKLDATNAWELDRTLEIASDALCLPGDDQVVSTLSGGEKRRVALCKILLEQPDLLLLDEPTNHLDAETIEWLEEQLRDYPGTVIVVTHDRYFLDNITRWILELENCYGIPWEGNYSSWLEQKLSVLAQQEKKDSPRGKQLSRELAFIKMSNKDRHDLTRARMADYEKLVAKETAGKDAASVIQIAPGPELGAQVIDFEGVSKSFGGSPLFTDVSFKVPRSAVVGLIGPNGTGKTTMLRLITGQEKPDTGTVTLGSSVSLSYVDQERASLNPQRPLIEEIGEGLEELHFGKRTIPLRQYMSQFGFRGPDQQKTVGMLSGGEMNRCNLAKILKVGGNVLLMDEPTNDLDVNTLRMLEEAILNFAGCALVISHDRFFLDRICTHLLVFEGEGAVRWFEGNFGQYEAWRVKEFGGSPFENRRNRYRKLVAG
ncbi:energy-dependent translational throttle protein EttA [bacterium]|nr:energy-dependent translational throttle protein EttA [bacterium]